MSVTRYVCVSNLLTFSLLPFFMTAITSEQRDYLVECMCNFLEEFSDTHKDILVGGIFLIHMSKIHNHS